MKDSAIFRRAIIDAHPLGLVNCHTALLPQYRGRNPLTWALIAGESHVGATVHFVDEGIDTGDIIVQVAVPVGPEDEFGLVRQRVGTASSVAICEAVHQVADGIAQPIPQSHLEPGFYVPRRRAGDEVIDWCQPAQRIHDFVRALAPPSGPCATTTGEDGRSWLVRRTACLDNGPYVGIPAAVLQRREDGVVVKCRDGAILACVNDAHGRPPPVAYRFLT